MNKEKKENEILIKCESVSKKFCKDFKRSLWYGIKDVSLSFSNKGNHNNELRKDEFWAVKDISFELRRGECIGLIGHNGAGKSTLLKILNNLLTPDEGQVTMRGRVGALIELGAGFSPILTGRENIYNNGAVLGFTKSEINAKVEEIIDFAEIREFIDTSVQNYSSGMKVRLGFAIAAQMEPDILIIDEVLAVGDLGFVLKCFKTIDTILPNTAIVFVSHSMPMVSRICSQIILMDHGKSKFQGQDVSKAIDLYYTRFANNDANIVYTDNTVELKHIEILNTPKNEGVPQIKWGDLFRIEIVLGISLPIQPCLIISISDKEQRPIAVIEPLEVKEKMSTNEIKFSVNVPKIQLSQGVYNMDIVVSDSFGSTPRLRVNSVLGFQIIHKRNTWPPFFLEADTTFMKY
jgi:lipopolysaccharide transport system ATP-binding protein